MIGFLFKLLILFAANGLALWAIEIYVPIDFSIQDGRIHSYLYSGTLIGIMNIVLKPILHIITLPFRIIMLGCSSVLFNALFVFISQRILVSVPEIITSIQVGNIFTYLILGALLAFANAVFHAFGIE